MFSGLNGKYVLLLKTFCIGLDYQNEQSYTAGSHQGKGVCVCVCVCVFVQTHMPVMCAAAAAAKSFQSCLTV